MVAFFIISLSLSRLGGFKNKKGSETRIYLGTIRNLKYLKQYYSPLTPPPIMTLVIYKILYFTALRTYLISYNSH
jgi:hypothetical protein